MVQEESAYIPNTVLVGSYFFSWTVGVFIAVATVTTDNHLLHSANIEWWSFISCLGVFVWGSWGG